MLLLKNLLFTIVVPGTVTVLVPHWILLRSSQVMPDAWGTPQSLAVPPLVLGVATYGWCLWDFATVGRGTPAPFDPPRVFVVRGLYRYVRNPMYLGVVTILLGEAAFFESRQLLAYAAAVFVVFHLVVVVYEEAALRRRFGHRYERYRRAVRRWLPGRDREERMGDPPGGPTA